MNALKILMLEDNPLDVIAIKKTLSGISLPVEFTIVQTGKDYTQKLQQGNYDVILCDFQLPDFDAVKALQLRNQKNSSIPFLLISGAVSEAVAIALVREGADDYILKDRLQRLPLAVEKAIRKQKIKTDKKAVESSLSELTQRFQLAVKASFDVIWDYDIEKNLIYCSDAIEKILSINVKESFRPADLKSFIHPGDLQSIAKSLNELAKGSDHRWRKIFRVIRKDGVIVWVNINAMAIRNKNEKLIRMVGVLHDVTEVRRLQHELIEQEVQNQKKMADITLQAQEKERMEIGKELHDNVNQLLATARMMINTAQRVPEMHDLCLSKSQEAISAAITELRNLAHSMTPPSFDKMRFEDVLRDMVFTMNLSGKLKVDLSLPPAEKLKFMSSDKKLVLYRIIQEQTNNIIKYAKAKNVAIRLNIDQYYYMLSIEDDGVGFDVRRTSKGIGLKNIESRTGLMNGTMNLLTAPGKGCNLTIRIPVNNTICV